MYIAFCTNDAIGIAKIVLEESSPPVVIAIKEKDMDLLSNLDAVPVFSADEVLHMSILELDKYKVIFVPYTGKRDILFLESLWHKIAKNNTFIYAKFLNIEETA